MASAENLRGTLKIFLGYASGVGKSFRMLDEARRRRLRGEDVVVGAVQPEMPPDIEALASQFEALPLKHLGQSTVIDLHSLVRRRPEVCIIDGLAYDNPPGLRNAARWQDVQELLNAGVNVVGSINIQYIAELREQVEAITGKQVTETVPISFIRGADEIEVVDAPAVKRDHRLSRLREMALLLAADVVDQQLTDYLGRHGIRQHFAANERILICITPRSKVEEMISTARAFTEKFHAELIAAYVKPRRISKEDQAALDERLAAARAAGARIEILDGGKPVDVILKFAESRGVTQLFIGHTRRKGFLSRIMGTAADELIRRSRKMDVRIFPQ